MLHLVLGGQALVQAGAGPTADAGADRTVSRGTVVRLDGSASQGQGLTYLWEVRSSSNAKSRGQLRDETKARPRLTTTAVSISTVLTIRLTVTDRTGTSATDTVEVKVVVDGDSPATFGGASTGTVTENERTNWVRGKLTVKDRDGEDSIRPPYTMYGTYGQFEIQGRPTLGFVDDLSRHWW